MIMAISNNKKSRLLHIHVQHYNNKHNHRALHRGYAFTLMELMIVIGLVIVLTSLTIVVGKSVIGQGKIRHTEVILQNLDSILTEYEAEIGSMPTWNPDAYIEAGKFTTSGGGIVRPEAAVLIAEVRGITGVDNILKAIPPDNVVPRNQIYENLVHEGTYTSSDINNNISADNRLSVTDAWGMEILYVHPNDTVAVTGEGIDNFDGYGTPVSNRPYFISAGPNMLFAEQLSPDTRDDDAAWDNLYSYEVPDRPKAGSN